MAMAWQRLADAGLVECRVLAGADDVLKATRSAAGVQRLPNLEIFRVPGLLAPGQLDDAAAAWAADFKPDVIFCALQVNLRSAKNDIRLEVCRPRRGDRKSTRLNSSHSSISYAVFCLKKKKQSTI